MSIDETREIPNETGDFQEAQGSATQTAIEEDALESVVLLTNSPDDNLPQVRPFSFAQVLVESGRLTPCLKSKRLMPNDRFYQGVPVRIERLLAIDKFRKEILKNADDIGLRQSL